MNELNRICDLIEKSMVPVSICDAQLRVVVTNEPFNKLVGRSFDDIVGEKPGEFLVGEKTDAAEIERAISRAHEGTPFNLSIEAYRGTGESFIFKDFVIPFVDGDDSAPYVVSVCSEGAELDEPFMKDTSPEFRKLIADILAMVQAD